MPVTPGIPYVQAPTEGPLREFYLRVTKEGQLEGPYTYYEANYVARLATREASRTGQGSVTSEPSHVRRRSTWVLL